MESFHDPIGALAEMLKPLLPPFSHDYVQSAIVFLVVLVVGMLVRWIVIRRLKVYSEHTANPYDDILVGLLQRRAVFWTILLGLALALREAPLSTAAASIADTLVLATFIASLTVSVSKASSALITSYASGTTTRLGGTSLIENVIRIVIYAIGAVVLLSLFDISIAPFITTLGIGGLAVALAFQDTLANIFAGISITVSQQIRIGDYLALSTGQEGFVYDIGWRSTTMRMISNNLIIIPNKDLAGAIVINYHLPDPKMSVELTVGVAYDSDPYFVEEVLLDEAARAVGEVPGVVDDPPPVVRFREFGESSLLFKMFVYIDDFTNRYSAPHEMMKRVHRRFRQEKIQIPFPIRTLVFNQGKQPSGSDAPTPDNSSEPAS